MRHQLVALSVLVTIFLATSPVSATDLRGGVVGYNAYTGASGPLASMAVALFLQYPNGQYAIVRQTATGADGMYYLRSVYPGYYVLQVGGLNYPISVGNVPQQDIPVIYR
jgi:hypothetical protein